MHALLSHINSITAPFHYTDNTYSGFCMHFDSVLQSLIPCNFRLFSLPLKFTKDSLQECHSKQKYSILCIPSAAVSTNFHMSICLLSTLYNAWHSGAVSFSTSFLCVFFRYSSLRCCCFCFVPTFQPQFFVLLLFASRIYAFQVCRFTVLQLFLFLAFSPFFLATSDFSENIDI